VSSNELQGGEAQYFVSTRKRKRGAPAGNQNRFKTGRHRKRHRAMRSHVAALTRQVRAVIKLAEAQMKVCEWA
jgi:hypothetical protein